MVVAALASRLAITHLEKEIGIGKGHPLMLVVDLAWPPVWFRLRSYQHNNAADTAYVILWPDS